MSPRTCPLGFWRDYRKFVRKINPDALLLGEAWWTKWPDELMDPEAVLQGDIFDLGHALPMVQAGAAIVRAGGGGIKPTDFIAEMNRVYAGYSPRRPKT